ncbi:MAG: glycosyltransferase family 1 protein [Gallionellaceae bacterium]|nr:MAG: glycosyltransferase family 1 protein [Gallionellaceae bacterium]
MHVVVFGGFADSLVNFRGPLLRSMVKQGHTVTAVAPAAPPAVLAKLAAMGVAYRDVSLSRTGLNPLSDVKTFLSLINLFREIKPDVALSYTIKPVIYGSLAARLAGVPAIYSMITGLGYAFSSGEKQGKWVARVAKHLYRLALGRNQRVFFQNPDDRDFFVRAKMLAGTEQAVLINGSGVDLQHFRYVPVTENALSFLLIARLLKDKGIPEYVDAARLVKLRYPMVQLRLLGPLDSNPNAISSAQISEWQAEGAIIYLGEATDVRPALNDCSIYVLPSYAEGMPRTVLEAMATGRAVITTDVPGCRETVVNGVNGVLVPVRDASALAQAMLNFIENPEMIGRMGKAGRSLAEEKYDVHKVNAVILGAMKL